MHAVADRAMRHCPICPFGVFEVWAHVSLQVGAVCFHIDSVGALLRPEQWLGAS